MRASSHRHNHTVQETDQPTLAAEEQQKEHQKGKKRIFLAFQHPCGTPLQTGKSCPGELWKHCAHSVLWSMVVQPVPYSKRAGASLRSAVKGSDNYGKPESQESWITAIKCGKHLEDPTPSSLVETVAQRCPVALDFSPRVHVKMKTILF